MKRTSYIALIALLCFTTLSSANADSCASVEREMAYGSVALEDAKDKSGFLQSAREFEVAANKAPDCAAAHFNLGLVYEKAGEYEKALKALQTYLRLSPNANDAAEVRNKTYQLEYRVKKDHEKPHQKNSQIYKADATWFGTFSSKYEKISSQFRVEATDSEIIIIKTSRDDWQHWVPGEYDDVVFRLKKHGTELRGFHSIRGKFDVQHYCYADISRPAKGSIQNNGSKMILKLQVGFAQNHSTQTGCGPFWVQSDAVFTLIRNE